MTNLEGRVILRRRSVLAPDGPPSDLEILCELADRLGVGELFRFASPRRSSTSCGGRRRARGPTTPASPTRRSTRQRRRVLALPVVDHPGTPRLFADRFAIPTARPASIAVDHRPAGEEPDAEYPLYFTTGRYKEHYNSGAQTRQVAALVDAQPEPRLQIHPRLAARLGVADGRPVVVESRRGRVDFAASLSADIRADTLFAPFHWGGKQRGQPADQPGPRPDQPDARVQGLRRAGRTRRGSWR